jgi:hypothetical protein
MSDFAKQNLSCQDYESLTADWEQQLIRAGYQRSWSMENGCGWCSPDGGECQSTYDAWLAATNTPDDLRRGVTFEPPQPVYRKPF